MTGNSHVAGVIDRGGGLRLVIDTSRTRIRRNHVGPGERVYFLPGVRVQEPVSMGEIALLEEQVRARIAGDDAWSK